MEPDANSQLAAQPHLARTLPPAVGANGVDLAVVCHDSERLSQRPPGLRVGGIALVKDGERAFELRIGEVRVKGGKLLRGKQPFINYRPGGERTEVRAAWRLGLDPLAQLEE